MATAKYAEPDVFAASENERISIAVTLTLLSGERFQGNILLARAQKLLEALNRPEKFIEFAPHDGDAMVIAKSAIASAVPLDLPRTDQLARRVSGAAFDPYQVLEVERGASQPAVRAAYAAKARLYHPDNFANQTLPKEVADYLQAKFIHVQAAYEELSARPAQAARR